MAAKPLNSKNYTLWAILTRGKLLKSECWEVVSGITPKPTPNDTTNTLEDWTRRSTIGWAIIVLSVGPVQYTRIQYTTCGAEAWRILKRVHQPVSSRRLFTGFYTELDCTDYEWGITGLLAVVGWFGLVPGRKEVVYQWADEAWDEAVSRMREMDLVCRPHPTVSGGVQKEVCAQGTIVGTVPPRDSGACGGQKGVCVHETTVGTILPSDSGACCGQKGVCVQETIAGTIPASGSGTGCGVGVNGILTPPPTPPRTTATPRENVCLKILKPNPDDELVSLFSAWHLQTPTSADPALSTLSRPLFP